MGLVSETEDLLASSSEAARLLGLQARKFADFSDLAGVVLGAVSPPAAALVSGVFAQNPQLAEISIRDIAETARRNFEPGGGAAALLFSRGVHAIMAHRVATSFGRMETRRLRWL